MIFSSVHQFAFNSTINFLLWQSQVVLLIQSLGVHHHITNAKQPSEFEEHKTKVIVYNFDYDAWTNNGLLTSWLLSIMPNEVLSLNVGIENANSLWKSIKGQLLSATKEQEHLLRNRLAFLKKGSLSIEEHQQGFKQICDNFEAIITPVANIDKVFSIT